jgi:hypothetical protein
MEVEEAVGGHDRHQYGCLPWVVQLVFKVGLLSPTLPCRPRSPLRPIWKHSHGGMKALQTTGLFLLSSFPEVPSAPAAVVALQTQFET